MQIVMGGVIVAQPQPSPVAGEVIVDEKLATARRAQENQKRIDKRFQDLIAEHRKNPKTPFFDTRRLTGPVAEFLEDAFGPSIDTFTEDKAKGIIEEKIGGALVKQISENIVEVGLPVVKAIVEGLKGSPLGSGADAKLEAEIKEKHIREALAVTFKMQPMWLADP